MKKFSELQIKPVDTALIGTKIKIDTVLDKEIEVIKYTVKDSKYGIDKKCLHLQIKFNSMDFVIFIGSKHLIGQISQVPEAELPIQTIIKRKDGQLLFT